MWRNYWLTGIIEGMVISRLSQCNGKTVVDGEEASVVHGVSTAGSEVMGSTFHMLDCESLEVAASFSKESFKLALRRFIGHRSVPKQIYLYGSWNKCCRC